MRFMHLGDLHIGKHFNGASLLEDQSYVLAQIHAIALEEHVDAVLIAGDVYDKTVPSTQALEVGECMFAAFARERIPVYCIPGNHDSSQRLSYNSRLMQGAGVYIAGGYKGAIDAYRVGSCGDRDVVVHLLPYLRPADVRLALPERAEEVESFDDAVRIALHEHEAQIDSQAINILVAHQFVTDSQGQDVSTCDSEQLSVGGTDNVSAALFDAFDYVALGHLHGKQHVRRPQVRYCGSPLKYSFSESKHEKSVTLVDIAADGSVQLHEHALQPLHDVREISATYAQLQEGIDTLNHDDYVRIMLQDEALFDAFGRLRALYPNILRLDWIDAPEISQDLPGSIEPSKEASPLELFEMFFSAQANREMSAEERALFLQVLAQQGGQA